jgi:hypothetical protein
MVKHYYKQCKSTKQVNTFLRSLDLGTDDWFDLEYTFPVEFDFDDWLNSACTRGVSINVTTRLEVFVVKYTAKDIAQLESELNA